MVARNLHRGGCDPGLDASNPGTLDLSLVRLFVLVYSPTIPLSKYGVPATPGGSWLILENIDVRWGIIRRCTRSQSYTCASNAPVGNRLHSHV